MTRGEGMESLEPSDDEEGFLLPVIRGRRGGGGGEEGTRWEELLDKALVQTSAETNSTIFDCYLHIMVIKFC